MQAQQSVDGSSRIKGGTTFTGKNILHEVRHAALSVR